MGAEHLPWLTTLDRCLSTNAWVKERQHELSHGQVIWAKEQTAGRGQRGRTWIAPKGAVTFTLVAHLPTTALTHVGLLAGLAACHSIDDAMTKNAAADQSPCAIKWPNDIYIHDCKIAGILCEGQYDSTGNQTSIHPTAVGIGINRQVTFTPEHLARFSDGARQPISLHQVCDKAVSAEFLIERFRRYFLEGLGMIQAGHWVRLLEQIQNRDWLYGRMIKLEDGNNTYTGQANGIAEDGQLRLRQHDGSIKMVHTGHISEAQPPAAGPASEGEPINGKR